MNNSDKENHNATILIVEDNLINKTLIQRELNKKGFFSLLLAKNGKEAIETTLGKNPDLILMDIQLPDMNGNLVVQQLREKNYQGPIIAVSANISQADIKQSLKVGVNDYIFKPIDFKQLFSKMEKYLEKSGKNKSVKVPGSEKHNNNKKKKFKIPDSISEQVLNIFFIDAEEKLKTIEEILNNDQFEIEIDKIKAIAHEYKGTASYFGLKSLERIAIELDEGFKRPDSVQQLKITTRKLMEILKDIIISNQ